MAGLAHLLFILFLYLAFCVAIRSHRIAGIAVLLYSAAPALTSFNSMFVYETLALAFMGLCMVAALRSAVEKDPADRRRWFVVAVLCVLVTVVTHHVTSYMLTGFLILVAVAARFTGSRNTAARFGVLAAISAVSVACWIAFVARDTIGYFSPTVAGVLDGIEALDKLGSSDASTASSSPIQDVAVGGLAILIISALIAVGCWQAWRGGRPPPGGRAGMGGGRPRGSRGGGGGPRPATAPVRREGDADRGQPGRRLERNHPSLPRNASALSSPAITQRH